MFTDFIFGTLKIQVSGYWKLHGNSVCVCVEFPSSFTRFNQKTYFFGVNMMVYKTQYHKNYIIFGGTYP